MSGRFSMFLILATASLAGCASPWGNEGAQLSEQDTASAVEIKAALIEELELAGTAIDVQFESGRVILSGFVETESEREEAANIARRQDHVNEVVNEITVK